jgi:hypothetical protein
VIGDNSHAAVREGGGKRRTDAPNISTETLEEVAQRAQMRARRVCVWNARAHDCRRHQADGRGRHRHPRVDGGSFARSAFRKPSALSEMAARRVSVAHLRNRSVQLRHCGSTVAQ